MELYQTLLNLWIKFMFPFYRRDDLWKVFGTSQDSSTEQLVIEDGFQDDAEMNVKRQLCCKALNRMQDGVGL